MKQGFIMTAAITPKIIVADVEENAAIICEQMEEAVKEGAKIVVFPELSLTGYTCGDLFLQETLLSGAKDGLKRVIKTSKKLDALIFVGLPWCEKGKVYNVCAAVCKGELLGLTTKTYLPNYGEFYEMRQFRPGPDEPIWIPFEGKEVPLGPGILYKQENGELVVGAEICEDLWAPLPPSTYQALQGALVIVNPSASSEAVGKDGYRRELVKNQSARLIAGYVYANAGSGESTTDLVFGGQNLIAENGKILEESTRFSNEIIYSEIDIHMLLAERRRNTTFHYIEEKGCRVSFLLEEEETVLTRRFARKPFVPEDEYLRSLRCEEILSIQAAGLVKRCEHTQTKGLVVGISGGLDSTLALLVMGKAFDMMGRNHGEIMAVTMPCFGTTDRTYQNACKLTKSLGATLLEVPIKDAVLQHFEDIGHDVNQQDVTYENAQARERTQVLMDIANQNSALLVGTGDLSELALGWSTYNGDHMSMYGVNASVPKTLVKYLVQYYAETCKKDDLKEVLLDILDTPVSPELLPPKEGKISQKTEDLVGPYELHDFFLYYMIRFGFAPSKIYRIAKEAFDGIYEEMLIKKWLRIFYQRFFAQQFKRSCLPDGPKVGSIALSPRGDWRMPSDASARIWKEDLEKKIGN